MIKTNKNSLILLFFFLLTGCMDYGPAKEEDFSVDGDGLFIINEGNFMYGNASLSYYNPLAKKIENEVFMRANGMKLGDVAQSMIVRKDVGWIVVNNSGLIFAIDINSFKEIGRIEGFTSPRYMHFLSDEKAYVTQLWDKRICIVNPRTFKITGYIDTPMVKGSESTEQMVQYGKYVFTNCWSYNNKILVIDTEKDEVCDSIRVGVQPNSIILDKNNKIWAISDGGYEGSPYAQEAPALYCIDAETRKVEKSFKFNFDDSPSELQMNGTKDTLYFINKSIWRCSITAENLALRPFVEDKKTIYYGLTIHPINSEVYVAEAFDYVQAGLIRRYSASGNLLDRFRVGITPGAFCWK